jgi:hypothetical protein
VRPGSGRNTGGLDDAAPDGYLSPRRDSALPPGVADAGAGVDASIIDGMPGVDEAACNACEAAQCRDVDGLDLYAMCFLASTPASDGPGAGMPKSDLCTAVLHCARLTGCAATDPLPCYCGTGVSELQCLAGNASGPCKSSIEIAAETASSSMIAERLADPSYAAGAAFNLLRYCEAPICGSACAAQGGGLPDAGVLADASVPLDATAQPDASVSVDASVPPDAVVLPAALINPRFDDDVSAWTAEPGTTATWDGVHDGLGYPSSGSIVVTNQNVYSLAGVTMAGAAQCISATPATTYNVAAQVLLPAGPGSASAGISIYFFPFAGCTGQNATTWSSTLVTTTGMWKTITGSAVAPVIAGSMRVRLVVVKQFTAPPFTAQFDNVLVDWP